MKVVKTGFSLSILATVLSAGAFGTGFVSAEPVGISVQTLNGDVRLIVKRQLPNGEIRYEKLTVPATEADAREALLLQDPSVLLVERDTMTFNPVPLSRPAPVTAMAILDGGDPVDYSDPDYSNQTYFRAGETFNTRLSEAHGRIRFTNTIRIGIIDGGFVKSPEVTYAEGSSVTYGVKSDQFYNSDQETACPEGSSTHGDQVAQVTAANSNNGLGIAGATQNVEIVGARALGCDGSGFLSDASDQIRWLSGDTVVGLADISSPVNIINMSLTAPTSCPTYMQDAIDAARGKNITIVVAAGNDSGNAVSYAPANCDGVVTVAATERDGAIALYSNLGAPVAVSAQGSSMPVIINGEPRRAFGTSFASPLVTGVIAAALSERPKLTPSEIDTIIAQSGKPLNDDVTGFGSGILDSMLFMDGAGVPREAVTAQSALTGEREQYQAALTHPVATAYLQAKTGTAGACELYQADGQYLESPGTDDSIAVFSVADGEPLNPTDSTAMIINSTPGADKLIISQADIDAATGSNRQLGVAHCNLATGANCSVKDNVKAFDPADIALPAICS
ncbi:S8 family serine peptidase [Marinobacter halotolerans]|uniref:S8 family serine peptidase n=1 Tax=Marinobacter halotolerans TaxID=1569211 RepID=UPI0012462C71|nr:S8 family serine peptidase [Marinobacter halotolerans]